MKILLALAFIAALAVPAMAQPATGAQPGWLSTVLPPGGIVDQTPLPNQPAPTAEQQQKLKAWLAFARDLGRAIRAGQPAQPPIPYLPGGGIDQMTPLPNQRYRPLGEGWDDFMQFARPSPNVEDFRK
jgi:hypothetical protein